MGCDCWLVFCWCVVCVWWYGRWCQPVAAGWKPWLALQQPWEAREAYQVWWMGYPQTAGVSSARSCRGQDGRTHLDKLIWLLSASADATRFDASCQIGDSTHTSVARRRSARRSIMRGALPLPASCMHACSPELGRRGFDRRYSHCDWTRSSSRTKRCLDLVRADSALRIAECTRKSPKARLETKHGDSWGKAAFWAFYCKNVVAWILWAVGLL